MNLRLYARPFLASIIAAKKQDVWRLPKATGPRIALTAVATTWAGGAPSGCGISGTNVNITGSCTLSGIDFSGHTVWISGDSTIAHFADCKFAASRLGFLMVPGMSSGAILNGSPTVTTDYCLFDYFGLLGGQDSSSNTAGVATRNSASWTATQCAFSDAPRDFFSIQDTSTTILISCYIAAWGTATAASDHLEAAHQFGGLFKLINCLINPGAGRPITGGRTAVVQAQGTNSIANFVADGCVILGVTATIPGIALLFLFSAKAQNFNVATTLQNNVMQRGATGYYTALNQAGVCTLTDGGNNTNFDTGLAAVLP